jgi:hypothetical protein
MSSMPFKDGNGFSEMTSGGAGMPLILLVENKT